MKTKAFNKRLVLNKKTIADLRKPEMDEVYGGYYTPPACSGTCKTCTCQTCVSVLLQPCAVHSECETRCCAPIPDTIE